MMQRQQGIRFRQSVTRELLQLYIINHYFQLSINIPRSRLGTCVDEGYTYNSLIKFIAFIQVRR